MIESNPTISVGFFVFVNNILYICGMDKETKLPVNPIKQHIKELLDEQLQNFELIEGGQQRTVGDLIESKVSEILFNSTSELISEKRAPRSKKSIEDVTLVSNGVLYYIDPKTHDINSDFSMPNLTSVEKIKKLFDTTDKELIYVFVSYAITDGMVIISDIKVFFLWELDISILGVGALGKGQLQIKNANKDLVFTQKGKVGWYGDFKLLMQEFLKKQLIKVNKQILEWS
jgi:hypothetical protein